MVRCGFGTVTAEALLGDAAQLALVTNIHAELHSLEAVLNASAPVTNGVTVAADGLIGAASRRRRPR